MALSYQSSQSKRADDICGGHNEGLTGWFASSQRVNLTKHGLEQWSPWGLEKFSEGPVGRDDFHNNTKTSVTSPHPVFLMMKQRVQDPHGFAAEAYLIYWHFLLIQTLETFAGL